MNTSYKEFMGFKTPVITEADQIFDGILGNIKSDLIDQFNLQGNYSNIWQLLDDIEVIRPEYSFVKEWFSNDGIGFMEKMDFEIPETDEILDFLDYQSYLLDTEKDEQTIRNLVFSITAFYKETAKFLDSQASIKLKRGFFNQNVGIGIPITLGDKVLDEKYEWKSKAESPDKTGLLLYK